MIPRNRLETFIYNHPWWTVVIMVVALALMEGLVNNGR